MATLELDSLTRRFDGGICALDALSLTVYDGEMMAIVGPSGSGKTTLLRLIAGLDVPTSGGIRIDGRSIIGIAPNRRDIAMVFQHPTLYPHMTVSANIAFPLRMNRIDKGEMEQRVSKAAAMLGIGDLLGRMPATLSGGQAQRVTLAKAMVRRPALCLFDEPVSSLDPTLRASARIQVRALQQDTKMTAVYVTHDQSEAMTLGDRVAVICGGRIQQVAAPHQVYQTPANRFVASFFGSPAMNFLDGDLLSDGDSAIFALTSGLRFALPGVSTGAAARKASLGLRPEAFSLSCNGRSVLPFDVAVASTRDLGDRVLLHGLMRGGEELTASLDPRSAGRIPSVGTIATIYAAADAVRLFAQGPFGENLR
jgi:multiple sugar transport system ATP-binding protein